MRSRDLKVSSLNVRSTQPIEDVLHRSSSLKAFDSLTGANTTNFGILERCEKPWKDSSRPRDIIVCHDDHRCFYMWDGFAYLYTFIGNWYRINANIRGLEGFDKSSEPLILVICGDKQEFVGTTCENALQRLPQFLEIVVNRGNNDSNIIGNIGGLGRDWDRLIEPMADGVAYETQVSVNPMR
jgi:hypothetical protein